MEGYNPIDILWSVKRYHVNRIKPPPEVTLQIERKPNNQYDRNAIHWLNFLAWWKCWNMSATWSGRIGEALPVRQLAGCTIGHVAANLCRQNL